VHLVVELRHPLADVSFECAHLQVSVFDEDYFANHWILSPEFIVFNRVQKQRAATFLASILVSAIGIDDEPLGLDQSSTTFLLEQPSLVLFEMLLNACFFWVANDSERVRLLVLSAAIELAYDIISWVEGIVLLCWRVRVVFVIILIFIWLVSHHLALFFHDVSEEVLDHWDVLLLCLCLLLRLCCCK